MAFSEIVIIVLVDFLIVSVEIGCAPDIETSWNGLLVAITTQVLRVHIEYVIRDPPIRTCPLTEETEMSRNLEVFGSLY
jgi:hypothetical protein